MTCWCALSFFFPRPHIDTSHWCWHPTHLSTAVKTVHSCRLFHLPCMPGPLQERRVMLQKAYKPTQAAYTGYKCRLNQSAAHYQTLDVHVLGKAEHSQDCCLPSVSSVHNRVTMSGTVLPACSWHLESHDLKQCLQGRCLQLLST